MTSGVYQILNIVSGKCYIGSSVNVAARLYEHGRLLRNGKHHSIALQRGWDKYGSDAFEFKFIAEAAVLDLTSSEQEWIDRLGGDYNMCPVAGSRLGVKHTPEARRKMSKSRTGKKLSAEHRANMIKARFGKKHSPEWCSNIAAGLRGKKHPPERTALQIGNKRSAVKRSADARKNMSEAAKLRWVNHRKQAAAVDRAQEQAHG